MSRIFNGENALLTQADSFVSLVRTNIDSSCNKSNDMRCGFYCGGVMLTADYALSAAACPSMCSLASHFQWSFDPEDSRRGDCTAAQTQIFIDPRGDSLNKEGTFLAQAESFLNDASAPDFMLIKVRERILLPVFEQLTYNANIAVGTRAVVVGFGVNFGLWGGESPIHDVPFYLQRKEVPTTPCASNGRICVGPNNLCDIDVGAPLFVGSQVVGLALNGLECSAKDGTSKSGQYAVFNSNLQRWIQDVLAGRVPNPPPGAPVSAPVRPGSVNAPQNTFLCSLENRRYFRLRDQSKVDWKTAQQSCSAFTAPRNSINNNASLATVSDAASLAKMAQELSRNAGSNAVWVGARISKGVVTGPWDLNKWDSGVPINPSFTAWSDDFDQRDPMFLNAELCLAVDSSGKWYPADCNLALQIMCEDCAGSSSRRYRIRSMRSRRRRTGRSRLITESTKSESTADESCHVGSLSCGVFYGSVGALIVLSLVGALVVHHFLLRRCSAQAHVTQKEALQQ